MVFEEFEAINNPLASVKFNAETEDLATLVSNISKQVDFFKSTNPESKVKKKNLTRNDHHQKGQTKAQVCSKYFQGRGISGRLKLHYHKPEH